MTLSELQRYRGSFYPLGHHGSSCENLAQLKTRRELQAYLPVAAQVAGAGEYQVSQTCQPGQRLRFGTHRHGQARQFG
jgi:hypothetical protein